MQSSRQTPGPKRSSPDSDSRTRARVSRSRRCFLNGVAEAQRDQRRLRVHLDQVLVERETIGERAHEVRGARGERAGSLAEALARRDADARGQVDLGRALRVRRDRRLAPAGVAVAAQAEAIAVDRCARSRASAASARISTTDGSTHAFWPGQTGTVAAQAGRQRQRRVDAQQRLVAVGADGVEQRRVVERRGARCAARCRPRSRWRRRPEAWRERSSSPCRRRGRCRARGGMLRCTPWSACGIPLEPVKTARSRRGRALTCCASVVSLPVNHAGTGAVGLDGGETMRRTLFKSKIHRATVTQADLDYEGSVTIDADADARRGHPAVREGSHLEPHQRQPARDVRAGRRRPARASSASTARPRTTRSRATSSSSRRSPRRRTRSRRAAGSRSSFTSTRRTASCTPAGGPDEIPGPQRRLHTV